MSIKLLNNIVIVLLRERERLLFTLIVIMFACFVPLPYSALFCLWCVIVAFHGYTHLFIIYTSSIFLIRKMKLIRLGYYF